MATERIEIIVTEKGTKTVQRNLQNVGKTAKKTNSALTLLRRTLGLLGGALIARQIAGMVDQFTNLQNRLKLVTTGTGQLNVVTKELFQISQATRSSFGATGDLYSRVALSVKELGISQRQTLQFTESLNQAVILSGAGAVEATQAVRQLSQGLASNRLSGDELRSVLEQLPLVADVIAKQLGVTRGELRILGKEGKISGEVVLEAFRNAREELAKRFAETVPTIGQAFLVLGNSITFAAGTMATASGASEALARAMIFLAFNMETILRLLGSAGLTGLLLSLPAIIGRISSAFRLLTAAILANPLGALLVVITTLISLAVVFADKINLWTTTFEDGTETVTTFSDVLTGVFRGLINLVTIAGEVLGGFFDTLSGKSAGAGNFLSQLVAEIGRTINTVFKFLQGIVSGIIVAFTSIPSAVADVLIRGFNGLIPIIEGIINRILGPINAVREFFGNDDDLSVSLPGRLENPFEGAAETFGEKFSDGFKKGFNAKTVFEEIADLASETFGDEISGATQERIGRAITDKLIADFAAKSLSDKGTKKPTAADKAALAKFNEFIAEVERENKLLLLAADERERATALLELQDDIGKPLTKAQFEQANALLKANQQLQVQTEILDEIQAPQVALGRTTLALNQLFKDGKIDVDQYQQAMLAAKQAALETDRSFSGGLQKGLNSIAEQFTDVASVVETTLVNAFQSAEDALVSLVTTGKVDMKALADSIINDLARLSVRAAITAPIASLLLPQPPGKGGAEGLAQEGAGGFLSGLGSKIGGFFSGKEGEEGEGGGLGEMLSGVTEKLQGFFNDFTDGEGGIGELFSGLTEKLGGFFSSFTEGEGGISGLFTSFSESLGGLFSSFTEGEDGIGGLFSSLTESLGGLFSSFTEGEGGLSSLFSSLTESLGGLFSSFGGEGGIGSLFSGLFSGGTGGGGGGLLSGLFGGSGGASGGGASGILGGLLGGGGASGGSAAGGSGFFDTALSFLGGFQNGGGFTVGGSGGPDSQLVAFRASPGEDVEITKPGQSGRNSNVVFNISTPDADSFQRNQGQIMAKTQAGLARANARNN